MNTKSVISGLMVLTLLGLGTIGHAQNGKAMTWKNKTPPQLIGNGGKVGNNRIVIVGCSGCNAYKGETSIQEKRRILCIVPGNLPEPPAYAAIIAANNNFKKFYYNWSGGRVGLTQLVKGSTITSQAKGDSICKDQTKGLGDPNARMIEHHDNKVGGWNLGGFIHHKSKAKGQLRNVKMVIKKIKKKHKNNKKKIKMKIDQLNYWARIKNQPANPWN